MTGDKSFVTPAYAGVIKMSDRRDKETKKLCHTHLPAAPYSSQGGELKTGDKFPSVAGAFRTPRGGVSRSDGVGLTVCDVFQKSIFRIRLIGRCLVSLHIFLVLCSTRVLRRFCCKFAGLLFVFCLSP